MECERPAESWRTRMRRQAVREDQPLTGMLELTRRCNFSCPHCYAGPARSGEGELTPVEWKRLLDEAADAGCLELVLSGGEPLLRPDFADIYIHAKKRGMEVTVFTNAALADDRVADLFHEWPPREVEVSVYGLADSTATRVTGVPGAASLQWSGIRRLRSRGVPVTLKTLALTTLRHEIEAIVEKARSEGLRIRLSTEITPRLDGDPTPTQYRLDPQEAARLESTQPGWAEALKERIRNREGNTRCYPCAAGQYGFFIDAQGFLQPCLALIRYRENVRGGGLVQAWKKVRESARAEQRTLDDRGTKSVTYKSFVCMGLVEWGGSTQARGWWDDLALARHRRMT